jgi:pyruvate dehydrogenase E1 component beta subunit
MTVMRTRQAVIEALSDEMESDPNVFLMGEDIGSGGPFKATEGLIEKFGESRVIDTPISEMAFLGAGVGAAAMGMRPVVEMMFIEFIGVALDQLPRRLSGTFNDSSSRRCGYGIWMSAFTNLRSMV